MNSTMGVTRSIGCDGRRTARSASVPSRRRPRRLQSFFKQCGAGLDKRLEEHVRRCRSIRRRSRRSSPRRTRRSPQGWMGQLENERDDKQIAIIRALKALKTATTRHAIKSFCRCRACPGNLDKGRTARLREITGTSPVMTTVSGMLSSSPAVTGRDVCIQKRATGDPMGHIFDGLKVLDCGSFIAAPAAATILSDFGADVIKIEPPGTGIPIASLTTLPGHPRSDQNYAWMIGSRNKRSLAIDLSKPDGKAAIQRLASQVDIFITNYPAAVRRKLGITYEALAPLNDRLIYASFSGYGENGAEASKPGFDVTAWWARVGPDGHGAGIVGRRAGAPRQRHGRSLLGVRAVFRHRDGAVSAPDHAARGRGDLVAGRQRAVGQWLYRAGGAVRRHLHRSPPARGGLQRADQLLLLPRRSVADPDHSQ